MELSSWQSYPMGVSLAWERRTGYTVVRVVGDPQLETIVSALDVIAVESATASQLLVDLRGVSTLHSFTDQYTLGQAAAKKLAHLRKVASLVPVGRLTRNSERPARQEGLNLRVFEAEDEALTWLTAQ